MSSDSVIEEDILEQIDSTDYDCDFHSEKDAIIESKELRNKAAEQDTKESDCENSEKKLSRDAAAKLETKSIDNDIENNTENDHRVSNDVVDNVDKVNVAIINYSGILADNVLQEALLINEIYTKDSINNLNVEEREAVARDRDIRKHLFPGENGRITSKENGAGYDSYLIDKLLRSKADPEEIPEGEGFEGFDGNEDHFKRSKEDTYPGLDTDDAYVKAELDRTNSVREISDKNNNQMTSGLIDPFDENILQTIHEDAELVIDNGFHDDEFIIDNGNQGNDLGLDKGNNEVVRNHDNDVIETEANHDSGIHGNVEDSPQDEMDVNMDRVSDPDYSAEDEMSCPDTSNQHQEKGPKKVSFTKKRGSKQNLEKYEDDDEGVEEARHVEEAVPMEEGPVEEAGPVESEISDEEPDCCEMTFKQKQAVVKAVRKGDITLLEKLLERKNADMGMVWYCENLLMVAIRSKQQEMAEFLIDNGIDWQFQRKLVEVDKNGVISVHKLTSREMAYDSNMDELVEILDSKMDNLFPFVKLKPRSPLLRLPIAPFEPPPLDEGIRKEFLIDPEEAKVLQREVIQEHKQRQKEIELENLEMMQKRRKGLASGNENESVHTGKSVHNCSDLNIVHDDISQVFGPDEGYETMSPVSPHRHYFHEPDAKEHVSIRATRAFHLKKAFISSKTNNMNRSDSPDYPMYQNNLIETVGSYNFERRKWHVPKSAPQLRNYSMESLQDSGVHMGLPFVHSEKRKIVSANSGRNSAPRRRIQSAHDNISPYSQVAKLLEQSRLFSPISRSSTPHFPAISNKDSMNKKMNRLPLTKTRMNYIYADRSSAKPKRIDLSTDLLPPKRKINCEL